MLRPYKIGMLPAPQAVGLVLDYLLRRCLIESQTKYQFNYNICPSFVNSWLVSFLGDTAKIAIVYQIAPAHQYLV
jgi:hypothetical protein